MVNEHRDRRAAEDPRDGHLQGGSAQARCKQVQGRRLGPEPDVQEDLRSRNTASSAASPSARSSATTTSTRARPTSSCSREMAKISAAAHAPFIAGATPTVMQMESLAGAGQPARPDQDLPHARVRRHGAACANRSDSRYIGLCMPRFLARTPYGAKTNPVEEFDFEEDTAGADAQQVRLGQRGLCDGDQHQPLVQALWLGLAHPRHRVGRRGGGPAAAHLPERRRRRRHEVPDRDRHQRPARGRAGEERLRCRCIHSQELRLRGLHRRPVAAASPSSTTTPMPPPTPTWRRACPTCSPCCRFAHYLKCIVRDKIGSFKETRRHAALAATNGFMNYVDGDPAHSAEETKARRPLAAAEVVVEEVEGNPGYYTLQVLPAPALPARRPHGVAAPAFSKLPSAKAAWN